MRHRQQTMIVAATCIGLLGAVAVAALPGFGLDPAKVLTNKIKFKDAQGTAFSVRPKDDGAKISDGSDREMYRLKVNGDKVKVRDAADKTLCYVTWSESGNVKVRSADQKTVHFVFVPQPDGDWKMEDDRDNLLGRIKKREDGYEVKTAAGASMARVKVKDGKTSVRDADGREILYTRDPVKPLSATAFAIEALTQDQRCGLFYQWSASR